MTQSIIDRVRNGRRVAAHSRVEPEEVRLNNLARMWLFREKQNSSDWEIAIEDGGEKVMGLKIVIEHPPVPSLDDVRPFGAAVKIEEPTVCVAGRGEMGRWQYFDV